MNTDKESYKELLKKLYDLVIVGGGPAGLSAAIYMARAKYKVLLIEKEQIGGQITITSEVVNYPGVERTDGKRLTQSMKKQAEAFGAELVLGEVYEIELENNKANSCVDCPDKIRTLHTSKGDIYTIGTLIATGAHPRKLGFQGEKEFQGRGVAYCATCDGEFFTGREVYVIGGGFAAVEEGIFLTKYASKVVMIVREEYFTCAKTVAEQVEKYPKIEVHFETEIVSVSGDSTVEHAVFRNNQTKEEWEVHRSEGIGVFVFAGYEPATEWVKGKVELNDYGYIITDSTMKTSIDGVYAAGDVCIKDLRQVVTAVSDGAVAAVNLEKYVSSIHEQEKIPELFMKKADLSKLQTAEEESGKKEETEYQENGKFLNDEIRNQLSELAQKFEHKVIVKACCDKSELSDKIRGFIQELKEVSPKIICEEVEESPTGKSLPVLEVYREDGSETGICFHAVPGGHEFNSFVIALYNTAGPGQQTEKEIKEQIEGLQKKVNLKVMVSLSCMVCPDVVMGVQRLASLSKNVEGEMFDLQYYPEMKEKYHIMSVPCMILNDDKVYFGKKGIKEIADIVSESAS